MDPAAVNVGEPWGSEEVTTGSDWFQRKAVETLPSPTVLTLLAEWKNPTCPR
jgi:hypothetical protein